MKGAIAAGHALTAQAGADVLEAGGNAVDACVAAAFVSWVTESPLTGPGAGGFLLVHRARDRTDRVLDFFVTVPGRGLQADPGTEMDEMTVPFDARTTQVFRIGAASCAVPGAIAGLGEAHRLFGRMPWQELVRPAVEHARSGVILSKSQAFLHGILDVALRATPEACAIYGQDEPLGAGDRLVMADLARTLELLADEGPELFYRGALAGRIAAFVQERGGRVTEDDLATYRVVRRRPIRAHAFGHEFVSNPPPSSGGLLIAFALLVLEALGGTGEPGTAAAIRRLTEVTRETTRARSNRFASGLYRGGLGSRLLAPDSVADAAERVRRGETAASLETAGVGGTTHISVVDSAGNAASLSSSTGCGSGVVVPGTGIQLNNMLGETDLVFGAASTGRRLTSMMSPSLVLSEGKPRLVVGSAGSIRLRGAIFQIVLNVLAHGMSVEQAIAAPRAHLEGDDLQLEGGTGRDVAAGLSALGYRVVLWGGRNLYFGGASAVARREDGTLEAAGDPRRGGAGIVVA